jgi:hypothetical protein
MVMIKASLIRSEITDPIVLMTRMATFTSRFIPIVMKLVHTHVKR